MNLLLKVGPEFLILFLNNEKEWKINFSSQFSMIVEVSPKTWNLMIFAFGNLESPIVRPCMKPQILGLLLFFKLMIFSWKL